MRFFQKRQVKIEILPSSEMTLQDWQGSKQLVEDAKKLWANPVFRLMMEVLRNESPSNNGLPLMGVSIDDRIAQGCRVEGYHLALNNLSAMARHVTLRRDLEATFEREPFAGVVGNPQ